MVTQAQQNSRPTGCNLLCLTRWLSPRSYLAAYTETACLSGKPTDTYLNPPNHTTSPRSPTSRNQSPVLN
jgi:hypothetical protein